MDIFCKSPSLQKKSNKLETNQNFSIAQCVVGICSKGGEITFCNEDGVAIEQALGQGYDDHITFARELYNFMLDTSEDVTN